MIKTLATQVVFQKRIAGWITGPKGVKPSNTCSKSRVDITTFVSLTKAWGWWERFTSSSALSGFGLTT